MVKMVKEIIDKVIKFMEEIPEKREKYFQGDADFTRNRKMSYEEVMMSLLNLPTKSLAVELDEVLERLGRIEMGYTKSAYSQAREKLLPIIFKDLSKELLNAIYIHPDFELRRWKRFRLMAADGSKMYLINNEEVTDYFGTQSNQYREQTMGMAMVYYDVLNGFCEYADLAHYNSSEREMVAPWLQEVEGNVLGIYDRGFPSVGFIYEHRENKIEYVMRCKLTHNQVVKDFVASEQKDAIVKFTLHSDAAADLRKKGYEKVQTGMEISVRLVRIELKSGETEVLITSLLDQQMYPHEDFQWLYHQRWGIETAYDHLKNQMQIEVFSGRSPLKILQEFHATIFTYNLLTLLIRSVDKEVVQKNKTRQHRYQINRNVSLGLLKGRLIYLFSYDNEAYIRLLRRKFLQNLTEDVKGLGKSNPRNKKAQRINGKYQTYPNYARAI